MNMVMLNFSPKGEKSNSEYFLKLFSRQQTENISGMGNVQSVFDKIKDADVIVAAFPLYVDGLPSHMLAFLQGLEEYAKDKPLSGRCYGIVNNGFYEGEQCKPALDILHVFCIRTGLDWGGGIGIGGGEMLGSIRWLPLVSGAMTGLMSVYQMVFMIAADRFHVTQWIAGIPWRWFFSGVIMWLLFSGGMLLRMLQMKAAVRKGNMFLDVYTHPTFCPRFLFVIFADVFWVISAARNRTGFWNLRKRC